MMTIRPGPNVGADLVGLLSSIIFALGEEIYMRRSAGWLEFPRIFVSISLHFGLTIPSYCLVPA
jgi:hypothetical protein